MQSFLEPFEPFLETIYIQSSSSNTLTGYRTGLKHFEKFVSQNYQCDVQDLIAQLKDGKKDQYLFLNEFVVSLVKKGLKPKSVKLYVSAVKGYLRYCGVKIYSEDFKQVVKLPKPRRHREEPLTKELILRLLHNIPPRLQTVILVLVASGMRIGELVNLKISDVDFSSKPTKIRIRAEITKTRESRDTFLTEEATNSLKDYLRRFCGWTEDESSRTIMDKIIFAPPTQKKKKEGKKTHTYEQIAQGVLRSTMRFHIGKIQELNKQNENGTYMFHFHSFRKFFYTTVSDVCGQNFAHALMGHHDYLDTYYNLPEQKRREMYLKAEPYLTISDVTKFEKDLAVISQKQKQIEEEHSAFREFLGRNGLDLPKLVQQLVEKSLAGKTG